MADERTNDPTLEELDPSERGEETISEFYPIPAELKYDEQIRRIKNTDPVNAETIVNPVLKQMIGNTAFLKWKQDGMDSRLNEMAEGNSSLESAVQDLQEGKADLDPKTGKVLPAQLPALNYDPAGTANQQVESHNNDAEAHPAIQEKVATAQRTANNAATAAANAQKAADGALEQLTKIANTLGAVPTQNGTLTYTGSAQTVSLNGYDANKMTLGGTTSATNAGTYTATVKPKGNYVWADGTQNTVNVTWSIGRAAIAVPAQSGTLTYTGSALTPGWSNYDSNKLTIDGTTSGTNAGSYNATFTPKANYRWSDGTTTAKTVSWSIGKAAGSLSISPTTATLASVGATKAITVTRSGNGAISATSNKTSVATVSVSGNTVTVTAKADGTATITVKVAAGTNHNAPADKTCSVTVEIPKIYGASWDGTSTTKWTRTDAAASFIDPVPAVNNGNGSSPFDSIQPWAGMVKSNRTGGVMVAIPKFWYKITQNGAGMKVQIANKAASGFSVSPAHMNRGDGKGERDVVYVGRYHCGATAYKSASGQKPKASITRSAARTAIHNLGSNIWQMDFAMRFTIWLLYIVEFADWNSQAKIGYGCGNNSGTENMGYTDSMQYHTGTKLSSRTAYGLGTQYRNIEGLWDNVYDWCDGCYNNSNGLNIILNPNSFSDSANGTSVGTPSNGWPSAFSVKTAGGFPLFIPSAASGSGSTYSCDNWNFGTSSPCVFVGGYYSQGTSRGLFCVYCSSTSGTGALIGCRLQELP